MEPTDPGLEIAKAAAEGAARESVGKLAAFFNGLIPQFGVTKTAIDIYVDNVKNSNLSPDEKMFAILDAPLKARHYKNQSKIAYRAISTAKEGTDFSSNSKVDDDWLDRFMDSAKFVSDEETQVLWGNVLAGAFESPTSTPPSIIRILSEMTKATGEAFSTLCSMRVLITTTDRSLIPLSAQNAFIIPPTEYFTDELRTALSYQAITELEFLGLIRFEPVNHFTTSFIQKDTTNAIISYGTAGFMCVNVPHTLFPVGTVKLSAAGEYLSKFVDVKHFDGYLEMVERYFKKMHLNISPFKVDVDITTQK